MFESSTSQQQDRWAYESLYNSLILFSLEFKALDALAEPLFDPEFELVSYWDNAFNAWYNQVLATEEVRKSGVVEPLNRFRAKLAAAPESLWGYDTFEKDPFWQEIRQEADALLNQLGETDNRQFERYQPGKPSRIQAGRLLCCSPPRATGIICAAPNQTGV